VYCPLAHWIFDPRGWLATYGVMDFAGGMVIHVASGVSAFVLAWLVGGKFPSHPPQVPHNVPFVLLGAALLWFGWFGFNAGSAVSAGYQAGLAFTNTQLGAAAALLTWNVMEIVFNNSEKGYFKGRPTAVGSAMGTVAGLVGITPACGWVSPMWAIFIGFFTSMGVFFVPRLMRKFTGVDDVLDCFAVHGVGGMIGAALTGLFANPSYHNGAYQGVTGAVFKGSFYGQAERLGIQCAGISVTILVSVVGTGLIYAVLWAIAKALGDTVHIPLELQGNSDASLHGEQAYFGANGSGSATKYSPHSSLVVRGTTAVAGEAAAPAAAV
jgi:Amt family ammonium transporter